MAFITVNFRPAALNHDTAINMILPENAPIEDIPTLYLLHGMHGDHTGWCRKTNIERYANERKIAVIMPDGENGFYTDMKYGKKHFTYVADELVNYTRRIFRLSLRREKTFICGLSMGGYGALQIALRRPGQYAACASLSGCVDIVERLKVCKWTNEAAAIWGDEFRTCTAGTVSDNKHLIATFPADAPKPRIYACCGTEDALCADNRAFAEFMADKPFDFTYEEGPGIHNWVFWDGWVTRAIDHMMMQK